MSENTSATEPVSDAVIAAKARKALGTWLAWPDAARDGPTPVTNEQVESWLHGLPNRLASPSVRITGDKDRENPFEGAPPAVEARDRLRLWFFRECNSGTRRQLFSIFGLPLDEIRNEGAERLCFEHILAAIGTQHAG